MQRNRKSDNDRFTLFEDGTLHLYDNLVQVECEEHTEYEGDLYITKTTLTQAEVEAQLESLLEAEKVKWQRHIAKVEAEKARKQLDATDYKAIKLMEKFLVERGLMESREPLREIVRAGK